MKRCPCDSGKQYSECCGQFISTGKLAPTPEALMRSRYSAYSQGLVDYIEATMRGEPLQHFNKTEAHQWATIVKWLRLQVLDVSEILDDSGYVEFLAQYNAEGHINNLHERSRFDLIEGRWFYTGSHPTQIKLTKKLTEIGRNDSCPCGSGKKYKRCCFL